VLDFVFSCNEFSIASILATIPALVLMVFGQRFIVQGLTMGSVK
jgi:multiple sugar transport system permease protein